VRSSSNKSCPQILGSIISAIRKNALRVLSYHNMVTVYSKPVKMAVVLIMHAIIVKRAK